jgi:hypothetical protein
VSATVAELGPMSGHAVFCLVEHAVAERLENGHRRGHGIRRTIMAEPAADFGKGSGRGSADVRRVRCIAARGQAFGAGPSPRLCESRQAHQGGSRKRSPRGRCHCTCVTASRPWGSVNRGGGSSGPIFTSSSRRPLGPQAAARHSRRKLVQTVRGAKGWFLILRLYSPFRLRPALALGATSA